MVINPYTFVALPPVPPERTPPGYHHRQQRGSFDGSCELEITTMTPLLLGSLNEGEQGAQDGYSVEEPPRQRPSDSSSQVVIPGSSLMGAFRSVHEAINNSCLRIVDGEYRAVHRTTMSTSVMEDLRYGPRKANDGSLRLAIIQTVDDDTGLPLSVRVCSDVIWVSADLFSKLPVTGQRVELDPEAFRTQVWIPGRESPTDAGRKLYSGTGPVTEVDSGARGWGVLVTDTSARRKGKGDDTWFACGLEAPKEAPECTVGADVRACFARAIEGTRDGQAGGPFEGALVPVSSPDDEGTVIGYRLSARGAPPAGTPV